jgi:hypothetical protein
MLSVSNKGGKDLAPAVETILNFYGISKPAVQQIFVKVKGFKQSHLVQPKPRLAWSLPISFDFDRVIACRDVP